MLVDKTECDVFGASPDGRHIVIVSEADSNGEENLTIVDAETGQEMQTLKGSLKEGYVPHAAHFTPDGKRLLMIGDDDKWRIWNAQTGQEHVELEEPMGHLPSYDREVAFSPDSKRIISYSDEYGTFVCFDVQTGEILFQNKLNSGIDAMYFTPDSEYIVTEGESTVSRYDEFGEYYEGRERKLFSATNGHIVSIRGSWIGCDPAFGFTSDGKWFVAESQATVDMCLGCLGQNRES